MRYCLFILIFCTPFLFSSGIQADENWETLALGLELGIFETQPDNDSIDSTITILRINPERYKLRILTLSESNESTGMSVKAWCTKYKLTAGINAGMFATDYSTHVGYMKNHEHTNSSKINKYQSIAAFSPKTDNIPAFRIFDLDVTNMSTINKQYNCVIQNLRLIKRPGINRWSKQNKKWSEVALGEDKSGNILFIFCRYPYSMYDFNKILLSLPINLICAQHLEGGPEAQMYIKAGDTELEKIGSYETAFNEGNTNKNAWPVPNIIGVVPADKQ